MENVSPCSCVDFYAYEHLHSFSCHKGNLRQTSAETFGMLLLWEELSKCARFSNIPLWLD